METLLTNSMPFKNFLLSENLTFFLCCGITLYMGIMLLTGVLAGRKVAGVEDFLTAGRRLPFWMATGTLLATWFGVGSSLGVASTVYSSGLGGVIADPFGASCCLILAGLFVVGPLRRKKCFTVTDIIAGQYGKSAGIYATLWMLPVYVGWIGSLLLGMGTIINLLTGAEMLYGTLIGAAVVVAYTFAGGMWAVTLTDLIQICLIVLGLCILLPGTLQESGGWSAFCSSLTLSDLSLGVTSATPGGRAGINDWSYYIGSWIVMGLGCTVGQDLVQRSLAAKDEKTASRSALAAGILYFFITLIPIFIGFAARIVLPKYGITPENLGGTLENQILPRMAVIILGKLHPVILVLFFSALLSAIMSSADSSLLAGASLFCNNIVKPLKPDITEKQLLRLLRWSTVALVIVSLFLALSVGNIYQLMKNSWVSQLTVVFLPVMTALYLPRASTRAVWAGMIVSTLVWLGYCAFYCVVAPGSFFELMGAFDRPLTCGAVYGFTAGTAVFAILYLWERFADKKEKIR